MIAMLFFQQDTEDEAERRMFFAHSYGHFMEGVELGEELARSDFKGWWVDRDFQTWVGEHRPTDPDSCVIL